MRVDHTVLNSRANFDQSLIFSNFVKEGPNIIIIIIIIDLEKPAEAIPPQPQ